MNDFVLPATRYALSGDCSIAYQVMGEAPIDLVMVPGVVSHVEFFHETPGYTAFLRRLSEFARVITFDKRGQGLSDRVSAPSLEERMDDVRAVMDAVGSKRAAVMGFSEGSPMSALFAATYPERVEKLLLFGGFALSAMAADFEAKATERLKSWGTGEILRQAWPSLIAKPQGVEVMAKIERLSASPGAIRALTLLNAQIDVRPILPTIRIPTLAMHRTGDLQVPIAAGRALASQIPDAKFIEYPGEDHVYWSGDVEAFLGDIEEFVTGSRDHSSVEIERILATVLFTDIVDSTRSAAAMGDHAWRRLLDNHDQIARQTVEKFRGNLIKTTGDGILATFDGPGRAVRCALAFSAAAGQIGLPLRAGLHTGEIELRDRDVGGIAIHAAARVMAQAEASEVLVSRVVTDLVAGAGLKFAERGSHELKGIPGRWDLFAAQA
ncbi:MAG: adenylate/guanylate cyclase domain-containing protein [Bradyrhizobium sp.]|jgi:class 3 adenylate cyclase